jgi:hypothetical protein
MVAWEDPPPARGDGRLRWGDRLAPLFEQPGKWAHVFTSTPSTADTSVTKLRSRKYRYPPGRYEFCSRIVDGEGRVYARYLGV